MVNKYPQAAEKEENIGFLSGIMILIVAVFLFLYFGLPLIEQTGQLNTMLNEEQGVGGNFYVPEEFAVHENSLK
ncbi:MAG: hypothetical protein UV73_C0003G0082 [Candidatus Gottesmanbacteria bacterium GW2011_GWA2_43_14]|uniref:Uncharacterized protein n=1 Tax=Candidatus Gottesmanbacteria bacterium GW2011_GWA2_43_14 TaxID=1618443 RepID=A0A0G1DJY1_9BACT|nr:MAG: hypothetical protein UV73_C0003G0082 [Candidatus Gottesmanbacteria bacterium GW2011_GWA2_43_14]